MIVHSEAALAIAVEGDLCILRWMDAPGVQQFDTVLGVTQRAAARGPLAILSVADGVGKLPAFGTEELRAGRRMSEGFQTASKAVSHVLIMEGFAGVTVRMFVATLMLARRSGPTSKVFSTLDEGVAWLGPFVKTPGVAQRIVDVYESMR